MKKLVALGVALVMGLLLMGAAVAEAEPADIVGQEETAQMVVDYINESLAELGYTCEYDAGSNTLVTRYIVPNLTVDMYNGATSSARSELMEVFYGVYDMIAEPCANMGLDATIVVTCLTEDGGILLVSVDGADLTWAVRRSER